jgi:hypothetical protein
MESWDSALQHSTTPTCFSIHRYPWLITFIFACYSSASPPAEMAEWLAAAETFENS